MSFNNFFFFGELMVPHAVTHGAPFSENNKQTWRGYAPVEGRARERNQLKQEYKDLYDFEIIFVHGDRSIFIRTGNRSIFSERELVKCTDLSSELSI